MIERCKFCDGNLVSGKKIFTEGHRTFELSIQKCVKCGKAFNEEGDEIVEKLNHFIQGLKEICKENNVEYFKDEVMLEIIDKNLEKELWKTY